VVVSLIHQTVPWIIANGNALTPLVILALIASKKIVQLVYKHVVD